MEQQFGEVIEIILQHKSRATLAVNEELLLMACGWLCISQTEERRMGN